VATDRTGGDSRSAPLGRVGFETGSDEYERGRPGYPAEAVRHLVAAATLRAGSRVLDLAAGTGKLTRQLAREGLACVAVEPSPSMRAVFTRAVAGVPVIGGTAEAIPVRSHSMDAVVVGQAFHWFDPTTALAEMARVLRPGGTVGLIWNHRDEADPVVADLVRISRWDVEAPYQRDTDFGAIVQSTSPFGPVERTRFSFDQWLDRDAFVEQAASRSYVQVLAEPERRALLGDVAGFAATLSEPIRMPYLTDLYCAKAPG